MTNLFVSSFEPNTAARNLDSKRLVQAANEAYGAVGGALLNIRHGLIRKPDHDPVFYGRGLYERRHPAVRWNMADRRHAEWTLAHARACCYEHAWRRGQDEPALPYRRAHAYLVAQLDAWESDYPPGTPWAQLGYLFSANHDWWRYEASFRPGHPVLPGWVSLPVRYRCSLLHKWLYLDVRTARWGRRGPPAWAFDPEMRAWITNLFGPPINHVPELQDQP